MKRCMLLVLSVLFVFASVSFAETDQVIEFMGIPWDTAAYPYITKVRMQMNLKSANPELDDFRGIGEHTIVLQGGRETVFEDGCGYRIDISPSRDGFYVAGYPVLNVDAQVLFDVQNGHVNTSPISGRIAEIKYSLHSDQIVDFAAATSDLVNKLSELYGEYDEYYDEISQYTNNKGDTYYNYRWNGVGSFVKLAYSVNADGSAGYINIIYGIDNPEFYIDLIRHPEKTEDIIVPSITVNPDNVDNL